MSTIEVVVFMISLIIVSLGVLFLWEMVICPLLRYIHALIFHKR